MTPPHPVSPLANRPPARRPGRRTPAPPAGRAGIGSVAALVGLAVLALALVAGAVRAAPPAAPAAPETPGTPDAPVALREVLDDTLSRALARAEQRSAVVGAQLALGDAERALQRSEADPLALRLERLQARQALELAEAQLQEARYEAYVEIADAYGSWREARVQAELARFARELAAQALDIARIRRQRGSATELDVRNAETELREADNALAAAEQGVALARTNLASLSGLELPPPESAANGAPDGTADGTADGGPDTETASGAAAGSLYPATAFGEALAARAAPDLARLLAALDDHPSLLQAQQGLELARVGRELLDPSFAPQAQIDAAELRLQQAAEGAQEARRGLELQARGLRDRALNARESYRVTLQALANAREREALERRRLEAGLIAEIAFKQSQLARKQAEVRALQAERALLRALLELQSGTLVPLEGLDAF